MVAFRVAQDCQRLSWQLVIILDYLRQDILRELSRKDYDSCLIWSKKGVYDKLI